MSLPYNGLNILKIPYKSCLHSRVYHREPFHFLMDNIYHLFSYVEVPWKDKPDFYKSGFRWRNLKICFKLGCMEINVNDWKFDILFNTMHFTLWGKCMILHYGFDFFNVYILIMFWMFISSSSCFECLYLAHHVLIFFI